jgi:predicted nucleic acid-binding OB-fold protein
MVLTAELALMHQGESILLQDLGRTVMDKIYLCAELLGQDYRTAVKTIGRRIEHAELTPSATILVFYQYPVANLG